MTPTERSGNNRDDQKLTSCEKPLRVTFRPKDLVKSKGSGVCLSRGVKVLQA
jgi:hypothetical protein